MAKKTKDKRIKNEIKRLNGIFKNLSEDKKKVAKSIIENVAFMTVTLEDLQQAINEKGVVEEYRNGANQFGIKESSEVKIYNTMIKNHTATVIGNASDVKEESTTNGILNDTSSRIKVIENADILALWSK